MSATNGTALRSVLVTGASRGIGRAIAERLAADGFEVIVNYRSSTAEAEDVCARIVAVGGHARALQFDVADRDATAAALKDDVGRNGIYYGVVCNAGIVRDSVFAGMSAEDWDGVIHTNLDGFFNVLNPLVLPMTRKRKPGRIVTISSVSGLVGNRGQVNYGAAKAGIIGATKALAVELAQRGITVNCVAPGLIETDMTRNLPLADMLQQIPAGRLGKPDDVAAAVSYLMSDGAAYVTRQVLSVNGGLA
jgi:3-oxoacyl-[acyl-carrier protein] reductase